MRAYPLCSVENTCLKIPSLKMSGDIVWRVRVSTLGEGLEIQNFHQSEKGFCFLYATKSCVVGCGELRKDPGFEHPELSFFICHITVYVSFHDWAAERSAGREAAFTGLQYHKCTGEISFLVYPPLPEIGPVFRWMQIRNFKAIDHRRWKHFSSLASSVLM